MVLNDSSHASQGPEFIAKAMRPSALAQQGKQGLTLRRAEFWFATGMPFGVQTCFPVLVTGISPATDRTGRRLDVAGHFADAPAFLEESHGYPTTNFQLLFRACGSHVTLIGITDQFL